jgi:ArsR family transcriptional regulator
VYQSKTCDQIALWIEACQYRRMSKQLPLVAMDACCSPLAREPLSAPQAVELARAFKAISDPVRLRLLSLIASHEGGEACVCDLTVAFDVTGPTISHHLKVLREAGLIDGERRGTWVYYRVHPEVLARLSAVLVPGESGVVTA